MKEIIYLAVSQYRVERMAKSVPTLKRGEIPMKLEIVVDPAAFREPVIEHKVHVTDWRQGIDLPDIELKDGIISEAEAEMIRQQRLAMMRQVLEKNGFEVTAKDPADG